MRLDEAHLENRLVLKHLRRSQGLLRFIRQSIAAPDTHPDPYMEAGCHPEIVERLWDALGAVLPADCRALVYGTPALVHPKEGAILAFGCGTNYAIRIPGESLTKALKAGCKTEPQWNDGEKFSLKQESDSIWVFGGWGKEESQWLLQVYKAEKGTGLDV